MELDHHLKLILDTGSGYTKVGISGERNPRVYIPTALARPENSCATDLSCLLKGEEALNPPNNYTIERPMCKGIVKDWDLMEKFWSYIFENYKQDLSMPIENSTIFMTEKFNVPNIERERKAEIFFERFNVSSMFICNGATSILWGNRVTTGFVIDFGYDYTQIVPMRNGFGFKVAVQECDIGGKDISDQLRTILSKKNNIKFQEQDIEEIKRKHCFCRTIDTPISELQKIINYKTKNNYSIELSDERYLCTEIFFTPIFGKGNLFHYFLKCLYEADKEIESNFRRTVVVAGGNSIFPGFAEEFKKSLESYEKLTKKVTVIMKDNREFAQFLGASEHSEESYISSRCMTKEEYEEMGASLGVRKKFFYI